MNEIDEYFLCILNGYTKCDGCKGENEPLCWTNVGVRVN